MAETVADVVLERLPAWGVDRIYGYPADGINGMVGALDCASDRMRFVQTRHEELAGFMACAHAKFTGEVGVCAATSGPGAIHVLNGLYDAKKDHQPLVAIVGQSPRAALDGDYQQEVDVISLFKEVAREYLYMASAPEQVRHPVDRALRIAKVERTVTCIILPADVQSLPAVKEPPHAHGTVHSSIGMCHPCVIPQDDDLRRAADIPNAGGKVATLVGTGALEATDEVLEAHITLEQARHFASAVLSRDAQAPGFINQTVKDAAETYLPHKQ